MTDETRAGWQPSAARTVQLTSSHDMEDGQKPNFTKRWQQLGCNSRKWGHFRSLCHSSWCGRVENLTLWSSLKRRHRYFHETVLEHQKRWPLCLLKHYSRKHKVRRPFPLSLQMTFQVLHLEESECTVMTSRKKHKSFKGVDSEEASEEGLGQVEEDKVNEWREREDREEGGVSKGFGIGTKQPDQT